MATQLATPLGTKRTVSGPFLLRRERHQEAAIYNGIMYPQYSYVDANYSHVDVARSFDTCTESASTSSYYVQELIQNNIHATNYFSNVQYVDPNSHASAAPANHMPMNNMANLVNQYETPNVRNFNNMQTSVSSFYSSVNNSQYASLSSNMPIDREIGRATTSYMANYSQPSYAAPHASNCSVPCTTTDMHNSAPHPYNDYSRVSKNSVGVNMSLPSVAAYGTSPVQVQDFGNTTLPKETKTIGGHSHAGTIDWDGAELKKFSSFVQGLGEKARDFTSLVQIHEAYKKLQKEEALRNNSSSMSNSVMEKAEYKNTLDESVEPKEASFNDQKHDEHGETAVCDFSGCEGIFVLPNEFRAKEIENIAEPCSVGKEHQREEAQSPEKEEDKALENYLEAKQGIVQVMPSSYYANVFKEVQVTNNVLIFRFGQNFIIDASISKILISFERPIERSNLVVANKILTKHIGEHIVPFRETDNNKLLQSKFSPVFHMHVISTWVALLVSHLAYIWSLVRHACFNCFDFRNIKPSLEFCKRADASISVYSKTSEKECEEQCMAEWGEVNSHTFAWGTTNTII